MEKDFLIWYTAEIMKGNIRKSYNFQFAITIIVTIIALIFLVLCTYKSIYRIAKTDSLTIGDKAVYEISEKVSKLLLDGVNTVNSITESVEYMLKYENSPKSIAAYLDYESKRNLTKFGSEFLCVYGYIDGSFIDSWNWLPPEDFSPIERSWYKKAVNASGKTIIVDPYIDLHTNKLIVSISKMLSDGESVISLDVSLGAIQNFTKNVNLNGEGYGFII
nr:cache domain-containing protein [Treponema sp.]